MAIVNGPTHDDGREFLMDLLIKSLDGFARGDYGLTRLVTRFESVIDALSDVADQTLREQLRSIWSDIEIVNAIALDEGRSTLADDEQRAVDEALLELRSLLGSSS